MRNEVGLQRGVVHHATDRVVGAEVPVGLLVDAVGVLGAEHDPRTALVGFQLIERRFELLSTASPRPANPTTARPAPARNSCTGRARRRRSRACRTPRAPPGAAAETPRALPPRAARPAERRLVRLAVGDIQARAIQAHQPKPPVERPPRRLARQRAGDRPEQQLKRLPAQPLAGLVDRRLGRHLPTLPPTRLPRQPLHQLTHHLLIGAVGKQHQCQHVIDHDPRRQKPMPTLHPPRLRHHPVHQLRREHARQNTDRDVIGQTRIRRRLALAGPRHTTTMCNAPGVKFAVLGL